MAISLIPAASAVSGTLPAANLPAGSVLQVVQGSYSTVTNSSSSTYADTGLTATITPKFATSKILILISHTECQKDTGATTTRLKLNLCRNGSQIIAFAADSLYTGSNVVNTASVCFNYFDSPATTSATTYKTQFASTANTATVSVQNGNIPSTITLMEIAV